MLSQSIPTALAFGRPRRAIANYTGIIFLCKRRAWGHSRSRGGRAGENTKAGGTKSCRWGAKSLRSLHVWGDMGVRPPHAPRYGRCMGAVWARYGERLVARSDWLPWGNVSLASWGAVAGRGAASGRRETCPRRCCCCWSWCCCCWSWCRCWSCWSWAVGLMPRRAPPPPPTPCLPLYCLSLYGEMSQAALCFSFLGYPSHHRATWLHGIGQPRAALRNLAQGIWEPRPKSGRYGERIGALHNPMKLRANYHAINTC